MSCCFVRTSKRAEKNIYRYRKNSIHPIKNDKNTKKSIKNDKNKIKENIQSIKNECIYCNYCKKLCKLCDDEIKILCSGCNNFYHCHIAGKCRGTKCNHIINNNIHRFSYCLNCVDPMTIVNDTCLCNSCSIENY